MRRYDAQPLKRARTEEGKAVRRLWADDSGMCKFCHKYAFPGTGGGDERGDDAGL